MISNLGFVWTSRLLLPHLPHQIYHCLLNWTMPPLSLLSSLALLSGLWFKIFIWSNTITVNLLQPFSSQHSNIRIWGYRFVVVLKVPNSLHSGSLTLFLLQDLAFPLLLSAFLVSFSNHILKQKQIAWN